MRVTDTGNAPTDVALPRWCRAPSSLGPALSPAEARVFRLLVAWLVAVLEGRLLQPLALLEWEPTLIQEWELSQLLALLDGRLLQPLALLQWEPTLIQPLPLLEWEPTLIQECELLQPLALLECEPMLIQECELLQLLTRPRSAPRSNGSRRLSDDAERREPGFHTPAACRQDPCVACP